MRERECRTKRREYPLERPREGPTLNKVRKGKCLYWPRVCGEKAGRMKLESKWKERRIGEEKEKPADEG